MCDTLELTGSGQLNIESSPTSYMSIHREQCQLVPARNPKRAIGYCAWGSAIDMKFISYLYDSMLFMI